MTHQDEVVIERWTPSADPGLAALLTAYHLRTEAEKGVTVASVDDLPARYRAEVLDPRSAFADDLVLVAVSGNAVVGCLVVTGTAGLEFKRLWTDPAFRGRGVASGLVTAALAHGAETGAGTVRLSVWAWRTGAVALYERLGFAVTETWDEREHMVCMERAV
ncbi:GNAT family N-acetyltransferase [Actinophytocola sp.]|uniref:GNAT family N-acetyltransferase n=1 Tax=Actinophytocola sp. TaxID=1872138 RepID=UPI002ED645CE